MLVGWGEELGPLARYLNARPDAAELRVATPAAVFSPFRPQIAGEVIGESRRSSADYVVVYANTEQRGQVPPRDGREVVNVRVNVVTMARLFERSRGPSAPSEGGTGEPSGEAAGGE